MRHCLLMLALLLPASLFAGEPWVHQVAAPYFVAVSVDDVDRAVTWYESVLGLEKIDDTEADDGRWRIANLSSDELFIEIIRDRRDEPVSRARGFRKVGFRVPDVERVADRVEQATGQRPRIIDFDRHGVRILQIKDPEGNTLQLTSNLPAAANP